MDPKIKISKLDAAKRQLEVAIKLYFNDADPVSIHTLTAAAHGILSDLNIKFQGNPMIVSDYLFKKDFKKQINQQITKYRNHFKHADRDPEATMDFNPSVNEVYIFDCCLKYEELTGEAIPSLTIFKHWFASGNVDTFSFDSEKRERIRSIRNRYENKVTYYSEMLSASAHF